MENKMYCDVECKDGHPYERKINIDQESCRQHLKNKIVDYWANKNIQLIPEDLQNTILNLLPIKDRIKYLTINSDDYLYQKYIFKDEVAFKNYVDSKYKQNFKSISNISNIDNFTYVLNNTPKVKTLNFYEIGDKGASAIAEALKFNTTVTSIDLGDNDIGDTGASAIAEALKVNKNISI